MPNNHSLVSIVSGSTFSIINYLTIDLNTEVNKEFLHVLIVGVVGGAGGYVGKLIIQKSILLFKKILK